MFLVTVFFVTVELTNVTSQNYVININDPWKYDFIGHPLQ